MLLWTGPNASARRARATWSFSPPTFSTSSSRSSPGYSKRRRVTAERKAGILKRKKDRERFISNTDKLKAELAQMRAASEAELAQLRTTCAEQAAELEGLSREMAAILRHDTRYWHTGMSVQDCRNLAPPPQGGKWRGGQITLVATMSRRADGRRRFTMYEVTKEPAWPQHGLCSPLGMLFKH